MLEVQVTEQSKLIITAMHWNTYYMTSWLKYIRKNKNSLTPLEDAEKLASLKTNLQKENQTTTLPIQMIFNGNQTIDHLNLPPSLYQPLCVCLYPCLCLFGRQSNRHHGD